MIAHSFSHQITVLARRDSPKLKAMHLEVVQQVLGDYQVWHQARPAVPVPHEAFTDRGSRLRRCLPCLTVPKLASRVSTYGLRGPGPCP